MTSFKRCVEMHELEERIKSRLASIGQEEEVTVDIKVMREELNAAINAADQCIRIIEAAPLHAQMIPKIVEALGDVQHRKARSIQFLEVLDELEELRRKK